MRSRKVSFLSLLMLAVVFVFQSCSKDEELLDEQFLQISNDEFTDDEAAANFTATTIADVENDVVHEWTEVLLEVERYAAGMRPNASARAMAYIYLASYETAVPAMEGYQSMSQQLRGLQINIPNGNRGRGGNGPGGNNDGGIGNVNIELALNEAFATTLDHFLINVPDNIKSKIDDLEENLGESLSADLPQRVVRDSEAWGRYVAEQVIAYSRSDRRAEEQIQEPQPLSYEPPKGAGYWTYSADEERGLFPYWGSVRTFVVSPDETTTVAPIPYSTDPTSPYFAQMQEVYEINDAAKKDQGEQLWIAEFWSDDVEGLMMSPPARQFAIANQLIQQYDLNLEETLALYLKLGFSLNDAAVATWKYKYEHMVMRPNVFIHEHIDPAFQTNLYRLVYWPNPSFPGYPSGHSCFASAAAGVFIDAFGNNTNFTDRSHEGREEFLSAPRTYDTFEAMAEENAFSRIPLGVHIRMDCAEGLRLGYEISDAINAFNIRRNPS